MLIMYLNFFQSHGFGVTSVSGPKYNTELSLTYLLFNAKIRQRVVVLFQSDWLERGGHAPRRINDLGKKAKELSVVILYSLTCGTNPSAISQKILSTAKPALFVSKNDSTQ